MIGKLTDYIKKYEDMLLYLIFGVLTTLVNMAVYYIFYSKLHFPNIAANTVAWAAAVAFAFITNKLWVFKSKSFESGLVLKEVCGFVSARIATGFLDTALMYIIVDVLKGSPMFAKVISNIFVVLLNYIFSKLFIFRKK